MEDNLIFDEDIVFEGDHSEESDKSSSSSIKIDDTKKEKDSQTMSIELAKMALAMGNTKLVEQFLKSLENASDETAAISNINPLKNYKSGQVSTSQLRAFTSYWDTHLKKLDIHLKLTIFNDKWIELDQMVNGNNTSSKKKDKPTGHPAKSEWWLSFADWTRAKTLMLKYLRDTYHHDPFADDLEKHFERVENFGLRHGWVTAFRYDIMVRTDVLCNRVNGAPGDPKVLRENFLEDAKARTDLLKDGRILLLDDPYAKGNAKERFSPITGKKYPDSVDHDSAELNEFDVDQNESNDYLKPPSVNRNESFKKQDNYNQSGNYQMNNRRNNRGKFRRDRSPGPYQRYDRPNDKEVFDPKGKGKQTNKSQWYKKPDDFPRASTSKDNQT
ncbi:Hypothetical protein MELLADRAFT_95152 [Melampsora larici-populina 98AG31]|uniref:Uncharacterized protein n=1 Tax=Melampsora larici-populina (strain 98AG31 / pathotype 3-4-7) TaxID=747676 RepID=F4RCA6_MELLP|nr:Hypothetical protein MELLADRAFT_95152 [Melampsora larici-populina 98AG31]EGG09704.1 Hypothetical protein MELLADRAFT_95152 [Melampsora larici-populina 98AG31]